MYVILGASGHSGSQLSEILLNKGEKIRVVSRKKENLARFAQRGADVFEGDAGDTTAMTRAFQGARAVYALIPPDVKAPDPVAYYDRVGEAIAKALADARVTHVVAMSSVGAHLPERTGPILGLHRFEQKLAEIPGLNVLNLRPTFFMENLLTSVPLVQSMGIMGNAVRGDLAMPMIATKDISAVAADALTRLNFSGKSARELLGERDVTQNEVAKIVGKAIGKPDLPYVQFPYAQAEQAMLQMGLSAGMAKALTEMSQGFNDGYIRGLEMRNATNTTPTTIETFVAEVFAPMVMGKSAGA